MASVADIVDSLEAAIDDVVDEGHKSGVVGTAFLHAWLSTIPVMLGYGIGEAVGMVLAAPLLAPQLATVGGLAALVFYFWREFGPNGDMWPYLEMRNWRKVVDSALDFVFPLVFVVGLLLLMW